MASTLASAIVNLHSRSDKIIETTLRLHEKEIMKEILPLVRGNITLGLEVEHIGLGILKSILEIVYTPLKTIAAIAIAHPWLFTTCMSMFAILVTGIVIKYRHEIRELIKSNIHPA
ncbi:hypothetical protein MAR_003371 [Mya arenaria]|uniref:ABC transmembrane type-1 domain-containing protein n=1 Tax=Mya arenaria TaxID=6604 RepID=A0ABY7G5V5_MYAAR|nr:uncharacterized protein LOC128221057 [Mya arenaria]WAR29803.1 hypothetical protein MAR_003371 [Mya arenaria]